MTRSPIIAKENGSLVLYSGSQRGIVFKYAVNTDSLRKGTFQLLDSDVLAISPGIRSTVSIADINNDGHNDYLTGNIRGGMMMFSDANWGTGVLASINNVDGAISSTLNVYPNPAKDRIICHLVNGTNRLINAVIYNMLGEAVNAPLTNDGAQTITMSVSDVATGVYVLQVCDDSGRVYNHKITIIK